MRVAVLNGVNLNVLNRRDPAIYGGLTLGEVEHQIRRWANALGCRAECRQTNSEGEYIRFCHDALDWAEGVIANPGAWTHYSYAIREALEMIGAPVVEVHLSDLEAEEDWRRVSLIADVAEKRILGRGLEGYREGLEYLAGRT